MEDFGKLLDNYAKDINASGQNPPPELIKEDESAKIAAADPRRLN